MSEQENALKPESEKQIQITLNGESITTTIPVDTLLSEFLREKENLTGTHRGCETSKCGACTVMLDSDPVKSCNMLAVQANGRELTTVEGLLDAGDLSPVQEAYLDNHGFQCGFCTPGFVVASTALLEENPDPTVTEIQEYLAGHICRCTGYTKIIESVQDAADRMGEYE